MEPMNLGSPPSSPASPNSFLPAFLMGEQQPNSPNPALSPGRNRTPTLKMQQYSGTPTNLRHKLFNQSMNEYSVQSNAFTSPTIEKGPPKQGLFDTVQPKPKTPVLNSTMQNLNEQPMFAPNESFSRIGNESMNYSCNLNDSRQMFYSPANYRNDRIDTLWVTVFGFQPSTISLVMSQLANCGTICEKRHPTQGNWLNVKFSSPHEVAKAMLLNGKLISNCTMIGVVPFYNKQEGNKENIEGQYTSPTRARSLRHSTAPPQNSVSSIVSQGQNVPQKSTDIVTKAMEYIFGW